MQWIWTNYSIANLFVGISSETTLDLSHGFFLFSVYIFSEISLKKNGISSGISAKEFFKSSSIKLFRYSSNKNL